MSFIKAMICSIAITVGFSVVGIPNVDDMDGLLMEIAKETFMTLMEDMCNA